MEKVGKIPINAKTSPRNTYKLQKKKVQKFTQNQYQKKNPSTLNNNNDTKKLIFKDKTTQNKKIKEKQ